MHYSGTDTARAVVMTLGLQGCMLYSQNFRQCARVCYPQLSTWELHFRAAMCVHLRLRNISVKTSSAWTVLTFIAWWFPYDWWLCEPWYLAPRLWEPIEQQSTHAMLAARERYVTPICTMASKLRNLASLNVSRRITAEEAIEQCSKIAIEGRPKNPNSTCDRHGLVLGPPTHTRI